jgi:ribosomal protein L18E
VKVLGAGELKKALTLKVHKVSETARQAVEKAGGKVELVAVKELKLPQRGEGSKARLYKARAARRAAKKKA